VSGSRSTRDGKCSSRNTRRISPIKSNLNLKCARLLPAATSPAPACSSSRQRRRCGPHTHANAAPSQFPNRFFVQCCRVIVVTVVNLQRHLTAAFQEYKQQLLNQISERVLIKQQQQQRDKILLQKSLYAAPPSACNDSASLSSALRGPTAEATSHYLPLGVRSFLDASNGQSVTTRPRPLPRRLIFVNDVCRSAVKGHSAGIRGTVEDADAGAPGHAVTGWKIVAVGSVPTSRLCNIVARGKRPCLLLEVFNVFCAL
jgi:hypothetical protein